MKKETKTITDAEKRAVIYTELLGCGIPSDAVSAAVRSGRIKRTADGNVSKKSLADYLEELGFVGAAYSFRKKHGLKQNASHRAMFQNMSSKEAAKIEFK